MALCLQGERTISQRKVLLAQKQEALRASVQELRDSIAYIDWKQNFYDEVLSGKRPYESNLILVFNKTVKTVLFGCCFSSQRRSRKKRKSIHFSPLPAACEEFAG